MRLAAGGAKIGYATNVATQTGRGGRCSATTAPGGRAEAADILEKIERRLAKQLLKRGTTSTAANDTKASLCHELRKARSESLRGEIDGVQW